MTINLETYTDHVNYCSVQAVFLKYNKIWLVHIKFLVSSNHLCVCAVSKIKKKNNFINDYFVYSEIRFQWKVYTSEQ